MSHSFGLKKFVPFTASLLTLSSFSFAATAYINQIGYRAGDAKEFTLYEGSGDVEIADANGATVLTVTPSAATTWNASGQSVQLVDFSELTIPGTYTIKVGGQAIRSDLNIAESPYVEVLQASLKWYYYQRASMALEETYAGQWKRAAGHLDTDVALHSSTGRSGSISSPKGWYDAGDYGKYVVNSGISTYTLLSLYEHFPTYFNALKWNIPADGSLPDLLAEIKYNLDWMLTMQDTDGGVFHKVTTLDFPGDVMPAADKAKRYVVGKGTAATFDFAAVMAVAARVYLPFDAAYAEQCLEAAKKAFSWGAANPNVAYSNPGDVATGEYGDSWLVDENLFAGTELAFTTGDASYLVSGATGSVPSWADVAGLATYRKASYAEAFGQEGSDAKDSLLKTADEFAARAETGFGVVMGYDDFVWGSNAVAANQGVWLLHAYYVTGEKKYYEAATKVLDYLLGKNPLNMSFLTGYGAKSPKYPHHRPSTADGITAPVPGMLVGGPQPGGEDIGSNSWECSDYRTNYPATSYIDNRCSYASNEVAINWNAPFAYLAGAIEALNAGYVPDFAVNGIAGIHKKPLVSRKANFEKAARLRFSDQMLYIEKNGKRYNLKGHRIK